jgi:hypothetical protein
MTFPTEWKNKIHVANHQTVYEELGIQHDLDSKTGSFKWLNQENMRFSRFSQYK